MRILPRPFSQVLTDALDNLGQIWRPLASTSLIVFIPAGLLALGVFEWTGATEFLEMLVTDPARFQGLPDEVFVELAGPFFRAVAIALAIQGVATLFVYLVCHRLVVSAEHGAPVSGPTARSQGRRRFLRALLAGLAVVVAVGALLMVGFVLWTIPLALVGTPNPTSSLIAMVLFAALLGPGIWAAVSMSVLTSVVAVEDRGVLESMRRSYQLVKGRWWPTLGYLLLVGLLGSTAVLLIQLVAIPLSAMGEIGIGVSLVSIVGIVAQGLIVAAMGAMFTHWYIDLRARHERLLREDLV